MVLRAVYIKNEISIPAPAPGASKKPCGYTYTIDNASLKVLMPIAEAAD